MAGVGVSWLGIVALTLVSAPGMAKPSDFGEMVGGDPDEAQGATVKGAYGFQLSAPLYISRALTGETQETEVEDVVVEPAVRDSSSGLLGNGLLLRGFYAPEQYAVAGVQLGYSSTSQSWVAASEDPFANPSVSDGTFATESVESSLLRIGVFGEYLMIPEGMFRPYAGVALEATSRSLAGASSGGVSGGLLAGLHLFILDEVSLDFGISGMYTYGSIEDLDVSGSEIGITLGLSTWLGGKPAAKVGSKDAFDGAFSELEGEDSEQSEEDYQDNDTGPVRIKLADGASVGFMQDPDSKHHVKVLLLVPDPLDPCDAMAYSVGGEEKALKGVTASTVQVNGKGVQGVEAMMRVRTLKKLGEAGKSEPVTLIACGTEHLIPLRSRKRLERLRQRLRSR